METVAVSTKKISQKSSYSSTTYHSSSSTEVKHTSGSSSSYALQQSSSTQSSSTPGAQMISIESSSKSFLESASKGMGKDLKLQIDNIMKEMDGDMGEARQSVLHLMPLEKVGSPTELIKLDDKSLMKYVDDAEKDMLKFNFDVHELKSESVSVKADGNKIEVHGKKMVKKDGDEQSEEYSRTYELPTGVNPEKVTSSIYKDGVLTIALPVESSS